MTSRKATKLRAARRPTTPREYCGRPLSQESAFLSGHSRGMTRADRLLADSSYCPPSGRFRLLPAANAIAFPQRYRLEIAVWVKFANLGAESLGDFRLHLGSRDRKINAILERSTYHASLLFIYKKLQIPANNLR